jgi:hypothetical protein
LFTACEFIVGLQNRYKLNKKFRKYKSMVANSEGIIHEDETLLRQHKASILLINIPHPL